MTTPPVRSRRLSNCLAWIQRTFLFKKPTQESLLESLTRAACEPCRGECGTKSKSQSKTIMDIDHHYHVAVLHGATKTLIKLVKTSVLHHICLLPGVTFLSTYKRTANYPSKVHIPSRSGRLRLECLILKDKYVTLGENEVANQVTAKCDTGLLRV
jgi:hypothetical protein